MAGVRILALVGLAVACGESASGADGSAGASTTEATTASETGTNTSTQDPDEAGSGSETGSECTDENEGQVCGDCRCPKYEVCVATGFGRECFATDIKCDPALQDCESGQKCVPYTDGSLPWADATRCEPIIGDLVEGDVCTRTEMGDDCGGGLYCVVGPSAALGEGRCVQMCDPNDGELCAALGSEMSCVGMEPNGIPIPWIVPVCVRGCNPLMDDCATPWGCRLIANTLACWPVFGTNGDGASCDYFDPCAETLACRAAEDLQSCDAYACCTPFCSVVDGTCSGSEQCSADGLPQPPATGNENVGVCQLPP